MSDDSKSIGARDSQPNDAGGDGDDLPKPMGSGAREAGPSGGTNRVNDQPKASEGGDR